MRYLLSLYLHSKQNMQTYFDTFKTKYANLSNLCLNLIRSSFKQLIVCSLYVYVTFLLMVKGNFYFKNTFNHKRMKWNLDNAMKLGHESPTTVLNEYKSMKNFKFRKKGYIFKDFRNVIRLNNFK